VVVIAAVSAVFLNFLAVRLYLTEPVHHIHEMQGESAPFHFSQAIIVILLLSFGSTLAFSSIQSGSGQFYSDVFSFSSTQIGYTLALVGAMAIIYQGFLIQYVRKIWKEIELIRLSLLLMAISLFIFAWNTSPVILFLIIPLFPLAMGTFQPSV
jgi:predicted MFS family arabinose efflux permease